MTEIERYEYYESILGSQSYGLQIKTWKNKYAVIYWKASIYKPAQTNFLRGGVRIYPGLRAELADKKSRIVLGSNISIGQNFHVVSYEDDLIIGDNVTISGNVFISNCDHDYRKIGVHILEQELIGKKTVISDGCYIGYGAVILAGTVLGKQCIVSANSVVRGEFPDYCVIVGNPGRIVKQYNQEKHIWERTESS